MMNRSFRWVSALLCYPSAELQAALPEFQLLLEQMPELQRHQNALQGLLDYLARSDLIDLQENYVATFDHNRSHAMYLFEHLHGEDRSRGSAMLNLLEEYRNHGFELNGDELPDYLPSLLEFFSCIDVATALPLLGNAIHVIEHLRQKLQAAASPYEPLLAVLVSMSPEEPQPLVVPPVRDMDEAMEQFGPDMTGTEPLLKPAVQQVKFYPKMKTSTATGELV